MSDCTRFDRAQRLMPLILPCLQPHVNIGTIGHVDHGKTTLSAAISLVCGQFPPKPDPNCICTYTLNIRDRTMLQILLTDLEWLNICINVRLSCIEVEERHRHRYLYLYFTDTSRFESDLRFSTSGDTKQKSYEAMLRIQRLKSSHQCTFAVTSKLRCDLD